MRDLCLLGDIDGLIDPVALLGVVDMLSIAGYWGESKHGHVRIWSGLNTWIFEVLDVSLGQNGSVVCDGRDVPLFASEQDGKLTIVWLICVDHGLWLNLVSAAIEDG